MSMVKGILRDLILWCLITGLILASAFCSIASMPPGYDSGEIQVEGGSRLPPPGPPTVPTLISLIIFGEKSSPYVKPDRNFPLRI